VTPTIARRPRAALRAAAAAAVATVLAACAAVVGPSARGDEIDTVDEFLARLGLVDLQVLHLEKALDQQQPESVRLKVAQRLADLYAGRLMSSADDPQAYQDVLARIGALIEKVPQANTTSLRVMLLQADYNRAESQVSLWINDPSQTAARDAGREILARITPELNRHQQELEAASQRLSKELDQADNDDVQKARQAQFERLAAVAGRATYFAAWSNYYAGMVSPAPDGKGAEFARARDAFRKLLTIEEKDYAKLDVESLGLDSTWRARAMIGLALSEAAAGNPDASGACFKLLEHPSVPPAIRDQAAYWYAQALLRAGRFDQARQLAQERIAALSGEATPGTVSLCAALVRAGFEPATEPSPADRRAIGILGIAGLAKMRQFGTAGGLVEKYKIDLASSPAFFLKWLQGQQQFTKAEQGKSQDGYRAAAESLAAALAAPEAAAEAVSAGRCRYTLAWCYYRLGDFEKAARQFEQAVTALKAAGGSAAVDSAWMAFASYHRLVPDNPRFTTSAIDVLESIKREFPNHPYAKKADLQIARLQQNAVLPEEAIRTLEKILPSDPSYLSARYDLCLLRYRQWSAIRDKGKDAAAEAGPLRKAVDVYLDAAKNDPDAGRKTRCLLLVVAVAMEGAAPDRPLADAYLAKASPLVGGLPSASSQAAEYHYWTLRRAQESGDAKAAGQHAGWLVQHAAGTVYETSALIVAAKAADEAAASGSVTIVDQRRKANQKAMDLYKRLAVALGDSPEAIKSKNGNALVAQSRLAHYASLLGQSAEAAQALERILAAYPKDKGFLRRAGLAQFDAGNYRQSVRHWRTLLGGLPVESDDWYEATYYQLACMLHTDKDAARNVFEKYKFLYPSLGPPAWRSKFYNLQQLLSKKMPP
jgi:tetratricopeptide (TPR) repeat protein